MTITPPTSIKTEPFKFTKPEQDRLADAAAELARLDGLLDKVVHIKSVLDAAAADFASGKITISEAVGLLGASGDSTARAELEGKLRRPVKAAIKNTVAAVADLVDKARHHHVSELASKAATLEKSERATAADFGVDADDFQPSDLLLGLREQHRRATADAMQPAGRESLNGLLATL